MEKRLYTKNEFEKYLGEICKNRNNSVGYIVTDTLGNQYTYGQREDQEASQSKKISMENGYEVKIETWGSGDSIDIAYYENLFCTYWNKKYSDKTTGFPTTEQSQMLIKCDNTLKYYYENKQKVALIMIDLDHFKEVNDSNNHDIGSKVLGEFSQLLFNAFADSGIMIHQTGDEFNILFPYNDNIVEIVEIVKKARDSVKSYDFKNAREINLSMAVGIKCIENELLTFTTARNMAEKIYNDSDRRNSSKQRDSIRIDGIKTTADGSKDLKFAWTRLICNLDCIISGNVYLEYIKKWSKNINILNVEEFQTQIGDIINWINPKWDTNIRYANKNILLDTKEEFSKVDLFLAIIQGLLKNPKFMQNKIKLDSKNGNMIIYMDDNMLWQDKNELSIDDFEGNCIDYYRQNVDEKCKRALLVQAGYDEYAISEDVFYKVIRVDTRPTIGGGLPDFWAATLCELITITKNNPFISDILIAGKIKYTQNIIELLDLIPKWGEDTKYNFKYISQKIFKPIEDIKEFQKKFQGRIFKLDDIKQCYNKVYQIYSAEIENEVKNDIMENITKRRILERTLSYEKIMLDICDGCRVKTLADAYPTVLEILRQEQRRVKCNIKDQAGRELFELMDFKIVLSNPNSNDLPDYYAYDRQILEEYYNKIFRRDDSLFKKKLMERNQWEALIKHVIQALKEKSKYATRRAVLVVSNTVEDEDNFSPLGLISIWLAPRFCESGVVVDFSYNWRTVEAVVGLPLSMYASVKFAEEMTNVIKEKVAPCEYNICMGTVSYIAHSLHMFLDAESMNIVRGIINDASI